MSVEFCILVVKKIIKTFADLSPTVQFCDYPIQSLALTSCKVHGASAPSCGQIWICLKPRTMATTDLGKMKVKLDISDINLKQAVSNYNEQMPFEVQVFESRFELFLEMNRIIMAQVQRALGRSQSFNCKLNVRNLS